MTCGGIPGPAAAAPDEAILQLTPDIDRHFLGPYLAYREDPQKKLTIEEVSAPQISARFVKHTGKMLNLGLNSSAYWIRFTIDAFEDQTSQHKWLLYFGWPNTIDYATLYIPKFPDTGWFTKEVGRILPTGLDPQPSTPAAFLPPESFIQPVTFYLRVESSEAKLIHAGHVFIQSHFAGPAARTQPSLLPDISHLYESVVPGVQWIVMGVFADWNSPGPGSGIDLYFPHIFLGQFVRQVLLNHQKAHACF
jgi:hypothetical protein